VIDRGSVPPTVMLGVPVFETLLRSRNDSAHRPFFWKLGNPTRLLVPLALSAARRARARSTAASSNTWAHTWWRQGRPASTEVWPFEPATKRRPAPSERFQPLMALMSE